MLQARRAYVNCFIAAAGKLGALPNKDEHPIGRLLGDVVWGGALPRNIELELVLVDADPLFRPIDHVAEKEDLGIDLA
jgi:hypothetical protein